MAKTPSALIDPDTGRPYRMCRKCGNSSPPHAMKHCSSYRRPVKNNAATNPGSLLSQDATTSQQPPANDNSGGSEDGIQESCDNNSTVPTMTAGSQPDSQPHQEDVPTPPDATSEVNSDLHTSHAHCKLTVSEQAPRGSIDPILSAPPTAVEIRTPDSVIDPALLALSPPNAPAVQHAGSTPTNHDTPFTPARPRSVSASPLRLMGPQESDSLYSPAHVSTSGTPSSGFSSPMSTPSKPRRKRPTKADPCFGEVIGAYRGNKVLTIRRTRLPTEEKIKAKRRQRGEPEDMDRGINIPKVFYDRTRSLVTQMHDLAEITGSWIHFSAQHPTASQPFIHYTSKRLRSEGGELLDNLHQSNHELYQSLMTARRCDTTQLAAQLAKATDKLAQVEADAEARVAEANAAKLAAEKAAAELRAMVAAANIAPHNM
ncbi:hypothetical protein VNI00_004350 [Paramarasmius palmivorus]|uniref:Uncharacterized protein n=1 Tax=Paramarasmius palmivorus TaxID=297713 RepID=A0AAW0DPZ6_9AGAR